MNWFKKDKKIEVVTERPCKHVWKDGWEADDAVIFCEKCKVNLESVPAWKLQRIYNMAAAEGIVGGLNLTTYRIKTLPELLTEIEI